MHSEAHKVVLILGANSDVAKEAIKLYVEKGYQVIAASRNTGYIIAVFVFPFLYDHAFVAQLFQMND